MTELTELLKFIDPVTLDYTEWVNVGMALKHEGFSVDIWDRWSQGDPKRYHKGECAKKWESFNGAAVPVTGGTIYELARRGGYIPDDDYALDWDSTINDEYVVVNKNWIEGVELEIPEKWDPAGQIITYLQTLFEPGENVGYVVESYEKDGKYIPKNKGSYDRTAGELIEALSKCGGDIGSVLGDYNENGGAWIRFNPLDGKDVRNTNVTEYRYALVESDSTDIERQNAIIRELELPVAALVYSGGKSIHAIVRIEAANYDEYRKRVDYLYGVCRKNGLEIDAQNRNPSRLSRMPGVMRRGQKQCLLAINTGKKTWAEWYEWIEAVNDDLPDPESISAVWDDLPDLAEPLIENVLRMGHKMLLTGSSKSGKSYALIELCCAIAEGRTWMGFKCRQGKVLYVNLELDRASCLHRFRDVYAGLLFTPDHLMNIDVWNLRGKSIPMDKLAPKLIRRAAKKDYTAIIIDPIYKVITGDENSADQMAHFCNQFDKVCTELKCAVIYCHHHSKGAQGGKRSMDRASGSGVFARDPDALIDLIELEVDEKTVEKEIERLTVDIVLDYFSRWNTPYDETPASANAALGLARQNLTDASYNALRHDIRIMEERVKGATAWRLEGTLREFPRFDPVNCWFDYPVHRVDEDDVLAALEIDSYTAKGSPFRKNFSKQRSPEERKQDRKQALDTAFSACQIDGEATVKDVAEYLGITERTVRERLKESSVYRCRNGYVTKARKTENVDN